jgi:predicted unusual protein kinase regulating ubiquinone biosynthesis (AarF/ABC1/UbiB family)
MARLGWMATGVLGGMVVQGARQLASGKRPKMSDMLLTPGNVRRVTDQLAKLRGAAMKVGQMVSMESGDLLPPALADIMARLRSDARAMPQEQLMKVMDANWGKDWQSKFKHFSFTATAAASIGQVHRAQTLDGRILAIKIQYPGVRESIDSDVDNVASLLRLSGLLPKELDIKPLLQDAKRQLREEADYLHEGKHLKHYGEFLADSPQYLVPKLVPELTTRNVLAMDYVSGEPIESLMDARQEQRDRLAHLLFSLLLRELFEFKLVQTDPNFANYRYDTQSQQLILLDFGATRPFKAAMVKDFKNLMKGAMQSNRELMRTACQHIGYFSESSDMRHQEAVIDIGLQALEPFCLPGLYDFGQTDMLQRVRSMSMALGMERDFSHLPPTDAILLQRKFAGLYLLATRLKARVDLHALAQDAFAPGARP